VTKSNGRVLATVIGMVDDILGTALWMAICRGAKTSYGAQMSRHGPADDATAPGVQHDGQVQEAGPGWDVGNAGHPEFVRAAGCEVTLG